MIGAAGLGKAPEGVGGRQARRRPREKIAVTQHRPVEPAATRKNRKTVPIVSAEA
jgi:hypothetical protein